MEIFEFEEGNSGIPDIETDEAIYDKYVPTDTETVEAYLKSLDEEINNEGEPNLKNGHIITCVNDNSKISFLRSINGIFIPPENFARVCKGIYRSSFPRIDNFPFLKNLQLKSILCLIPEEYPIENEEFNKLNNIKVYQIGLSGNKEPFVKIKPELVTDALKILLNPENQPILIHCNRGKHRTGCVVGCIRRIQNWSQSMIFDEYRRYAYPKERPLDQQFIEMYDINDIRNYAIENNLSFKW